jgi:putative copper export protein
VLAAQLNNGLDTLRLSLHVLAAAMWVGGQFVVAGLLPTVRGFGEDAPKKIALAFGRLSWPAYFVAWATGIWNMIAVRSEHTGSGWHAVLGIKMVVVVAVGLLVLAHQRATTAKVRGATAGSGALLSLAALVLGVALAG